MEKAKTDTSRISISAHYTAYVWSKHKLQTPEFATFRGLLAHLLLRPSNLLGKMLMGADIDTFLLQRHMVMDELICRAVAAGFTQIVDLAAGLSGRGFRLCRQYKDLIYIEGDLPQMAVMKQRLLAGMKGYDPVRHKIRACNILEKDTGAGMERLFEAEVARSQGTLVITEGLVNYFPLPVITEVWRRLSSLLSSVQKGIYISEIYPDLIDHPYYGMMKLARKGVGWFTRGDWPLHFKSDAEIQSAFLNLGYETVSVFDPADFYDLLPIPRVAVPTMVRIVQAEI